MINNYYKKFHWFFFLYSNWRTTEFYLLYEFVDSINSWIQTYKFPWVLSRIHGWKSWISCNLNALYEHWVKSQFKFVFWARSNWLFIHEKPWAETLSEHINNICLLPHWLSPYLDCGCNATPFKYTPTNRHKHATIDVPILKWKIINWTDILYLLYLIELKKSIFI